MSKQTITEDDFKFVMTMHKDLILYLTCTEELKYEQDIYGFSINIWNEDLYGNTWVALKNGIATVLVYDGHYNDYRPEHSFKTWQELNRWMNDGFIKDHLWELSYASKELKIQYLGDENFKYDPFKKEK